MKNPAWLSKEAGAVTIGDKYLPALEIETQADADEYFELLVTHCMKFGKTREESEKIERANLGYFGGYASHEKRARVEKLFRCAHPVFGAISTEGPPSAEDALKAGIAVGKAARRIR